MTYKLDADTLTLYLDNDSAINSETTPSFDATGKFLFGEMFVGGLPTVATSAFDGSVAEIICYNKALSDLDRKKVESYLNKKYKIY